uniref:Uncharacterized protein n=1 Tax=Heterorhabditis bacteriophora TaxID=37862 RepID=A0A1I7WVA3_HETBA
MPNNLKEANNLKYVSRIFSLIIIIEILIFEKKRLGILTYNITEVICSKIGISELDKTILPSRTHLFESGMTPLIRNNISLECIKNICKEYIENKNKPRQ